MDVAEVEENLVAATDAKVLLHLWLFQILFGNF